jgi:hypothetical protein
MSGDSRRARRFIRGGSQIPAAGAGRAAVPDNFPTVLFPFSFLPLDRLSRAVPPLPAYPGSPERAFRTTRGGKLTLLFRFPLRLPLNIHLEIDSEIDSEIYSEHFHRSVCFRFSGVFKAEGSPDTWF